MPSMVYVVFLVNTAVEAVLLLGGALYAHSNAIVGEGMPHATITAVLEQFSVHF